MNKGAILGLTRTAAVEWGRFNIRTNAIAPTGMGQVFADLAENVPGFLEMATASNPLSSSAVAVTNTPARCAGRSLMITAAASGVTVRLPPGARITPW